MSRALNDPKRIVIVNAGSRLSLSAEKGSYDMLVENIKDGINNLIQSDNDKKKEFTPVEVVKSIEEIGSLQWGDALIFVTLGMRYEAQKIKDKMPRVKVFVTTGLLPKDEVILLDKTLATAENLYELIRFA